MSETLNFADLCRKHGIRVVVCVPGMRIEYRIQKRGLFGVYWTQATRSNETEARELAKGYAAALEEEGKVVWP